MLNGKPSIEYPESDRLVWHLDGDRRRAEVDRRRDTARKITSVQHGHFGAYVTDMLRHRYHRDTYEALKIDHGLVLTDNPLNDIMEKRCTAWAGGATYRLRSDAAQPDGEPQQDSAAEQALAAWVQATNPDNLAKQLDLLTELHPAVLVCPIVVDQDRTGKRVHAWAVHTPETFDLVPCSDNPTDYEAVDVYHDWHDERGTCVSARTRWTAEERSLYVQRNGHWVVQEREENPYRVIPGVVFRRERPINSLWAACPGEALADCTIEVACHQTMLGYLAGSQAKVLVGEFQGFPQGQVLRSGGVIGLGPGENFQLVDYQTDVAGYRATYCEAPRVRMAVALGLNADEFQARQAESGEALKMRYWKRDEYSRNKRSYLRESMAELFWLSQLVLAYHLALPDMPEIDGIASVVGRVDGANLIADQTLVIDVNETTYPELAAERATREDRDLELGLTTLADLYMQRNPDCASLDEAIAAVRQNKALNAQFERAATAPGMRAALPAPGQSRTVLSVTQR